MGGVENKIEEKRVEDHKSNTSIINITTKTEEKPVVVTDTCKDCQVDEDRNQLMVRRKARGKGKAKSIMLSDTPFT